MKMIDLKLQFKYFEQLLDLNHCTEMCNVPYPPTLLEKFCLLKCQCHLRTMLVREEMKKHGKIIFEFVIQSDPEILSIK